MDSSDQANYNGDGGDAEKEEDDFVDADSSLPNEDSEPERDTADLRESDRTEMVEPVRSLEDVALEEHAEGSPKRRKVEPKEEAGEEVGERAGEDEELEGGRVAGVGDEEDGEKPASNGDASTPGADGGGNVNGARNGVESGSATPAVASTSNSKKSSKKKSGNNVWVTKSTRKGKKKSKAVGNNNHSNGTNGHGGLLPQEDKVLITPIPRFPDRTDDSPEMSICLSRTYKAEKVELSEDRLTAGSTKGYRMVRATRGVVEGAWYFEIKVVSLGETGHTRLGWTTEKGDLQAPVGYDGNSYGYRDIDGSKVHKALREKYGEEGYKEGDVVGCYLSLPDGGKYAPLQPRLVWYKGQRYACAADSKEDPSKVVPGSEISFFKNGICQGVAFKDLQGERYFPAASMYTLPNQPNCEVRFNFGPDFESFPDNFDGRPVPKPMSEAPYHGYSDQTENSTPDNGNQAEKKH